MQIAYALSVTNAWEIAPLQFTPMERPLFTLCATEMLSASNLAEVGPSLDASEFLAVLFLVLIGVSLNLYL